MKFQTLKIIYRANESNIQSLLLIYTDKHPKVSQAYDQNISLENQLKKNFR